MTCVVGLVGGDGHVYIGGDSAGMAGWSLRLRADEKVFTREECVFGFTSSFRMGQLLRYRLSVDMPPVRDPDLDRYMATTFVDAVRECLREGGYAEKDNGVETGGEFLVGLRGRLYRVGRDFQIARSRYVFEAIGSGGDEARGALYALTGAQDITNPEHVVRQALEASAALSGGVCAPFEVASA